MWNADAVVDAEDLALAREDVPALAVGVVDQQSKTASRRSAGSSAWMTVTAESSASRPSTSGTTRAWAPSCRHQVDQLRDGVVLGLDPHLQRTRARTARR